MIALISPGVASCEYTLNTLRYADRVKELVATDALDTSRLTTPLSEDVSGNLFANDSGEIDSDINMTDDIDLLSAEWEVLESKEISLQVVSDFFSRARQWDVTKTGKYDKPEFSRCWKDMCAELLDFMKTSMVKADRLNSILEKK